MSAPAVAVTQGQADLAASIINSVIRTLDDRTMLSIQDYIRSEVARRQIPHLAELPAIRAQQPSAELASTLSPSQIKMFIDCAAKWWYRYGLGLPDVRTSYLGLGAAIHQAIDTSMNQKIETRADLEAGRVLELFNEAWAREKDSVTFDEEEDPAAIAVEGGSLIALYMKEVAPRIQPAAVELSVAGEIGGVAVRGKVDLLDVAGTIHDTKTSTKSPSKDKRTGADQIDPAYRAQVATYVQITDGASGRVSLDYLVKTKTPKVVNQTWDVAGADKRLVDEIYPLAQAAMRSGLYVPNRASFTCSKRHCPYWRQCEQEYGGEV